VFVFPVFPDPADRPAEPDLDFTGPVPCVECLAFWGRAVQTGAVPRAYAIGVVAEHRLLTSIPDASERYEQAAEDIDFWLDTLLDLIGGADYLLGRLAEEEERRRQDHRALTLMDRMGIPSGCPADLDFAGLVEHLDQVQLVRAFLEAFGDVVFGESADDPHDR
jgi:hypothetical protein